MVLIDNTKDLKKICTKLKKSEFITVDTEFIRERSYWARLCLIQVAGDDDAFAIDPLAEDIDLTPFYEILLDKNILKVFHACRQDLEIFFKEMEGKLPMPVFDTQIAAMVCGYGEQVSYEALVKAITKKQIDKSSRFTDWARRPLSAKQLKYALGDVTHLRKVYESLNNDLEEKKRKSWIKDEFKTLTNKSNYLSKSDEAWKRIKINTNKPRTLGILKEVAAWREELAKHANVPRGRILRDDVLAGIAMHPPKNQDELAAMRGIQSGFAKSEKGAELILAVKKGKAIPDEDLPIREKRKPMPSGLAPAVEILRVFLKMKCEDNNVASRLIAKASDLELIAAYKKEADVLAMKGWRFKLFGKEAIELLEGKLALIIKDNMLQVIKL